MDKPSIEEFYGNDSPTMDELLSSMSDEERAEFDAVCEARHDADVAHMMMEMDNLPY